MTAPLDPAWASSSSVRMPFTVFPCLELPFVSVINIEHLWYASNHSRNLRDKTLFLRGLEWTPFSLFFFLAYIFIPPTLQTLPQGRPFWGVCFFNQKQSLCPLKICSIFLLLLLRYLGFFFSSSSQCCRVCFFLMFFWLICFWGVKGLGYKL